MAFLCWRILFGVTLMIRSYLALPIRNIELERTEASPIAISRNYFKYLEGTRDLITDLVTELQFRGQAKIVFWQIRSQK